MTRLNLVLLLAVMLSALYLVQLQYASRHLYASIERAKQVGARLTADQEQLVVQQREQATTSRVQRLATQRLNMLAAHPGITEYVDWPAATPERGRP